MMYGSGHVYVLTVEILETDEPDLIELRVSVKISDLMHSKSFCLCC